MFHPEIYEKFKDVSKIGESSIAAWFPNGLNSIRVNLVGGGEFVFIYHGVNDWILETIDEFLDTMVVKR